MGMLSTSLRAGMTGVAAAALFGVTPLAAQSSDNPTVGRDGAHDFDFNFGVWSTHITRTADPFSAPDKSVIMEGVVTVRKVWGGKASLEEIEADGPAGHWEGATLFVYNPQTRQWSQSFASARLGLLPPPMIGRFQDGRGEMSGTDTFNDRQILVRGTWSDITVDAHRYQEELSDDGGRTWHTSFIGQLKRLTPDACARAKIDCASPTR